MAHRPSSPEHERRALALFEHLVENPGNEKLRARLTREEPEAVLSRLRALETSATRAVGAIPTLIPGSGDCDGMLPPPERVGAFRLTARIGRGGMGDIWLGRRDDGLYDQKVAVKLIQQHALTCAADAFDDERRFLAQLEHPNVARLIDGGVTEDGLPWLAMEYFDGQPIDIASVGLSQRDRVQLFIKAADAVQYAHTRLIAHADLKPSNILVDAGGRVKLLDFGIAGLIGAGTRGGGGSGPLTRAFSSPERISGAGPSVADDVYALGKTLALILDGHGETELAAVAAKAHHADPALRYGSAAELIADLERWRARLPLRAMPDRAAYHASKFVARHRIGVVATGLALIGLSASSVLATSNYVRAEGERSEAAARFEDARGAARYISVQLLDQLAAQPGTLALRAEAAGVAQRYLDRLAASPSAKADVQIEAAEGLYRLAAAQARPGRPNLGETDAARANLARAASLIGGFDAPAARELGIRIRLDQARLASHVTNDVAAALVFLREAAWLLRHGSPGVALRGQYEIELSAAEQWGGDYRASIAASRRALAILPERGDRDAILRRSTAYDLLAEGIYYLRDEKAAIPPYREALRIAERAAAAYPGDQIVKRHVARAQWALGTTLLGNGGDAEALLLLENSAAAIAAIAAADPADADAARMLRIAENARAQALAANGRVDEAVAIFSKGVAEREALWRARADEPILLRDYMVAMKGLGDLLADYGHAAQGCIRYRQTQMLLARIARERRLTGLDVSDTSVDLARRMKRYCSIRT